jgi:prostaglandin-H2 D-isomerase / glutathione transferase
MGRTQSAAMYKLKLTYFDMHAGRGEVARIALFIGGVAYEDDRIKFQDWPALKDKTPFGGIPVLEVDGQIVVQSNGINRFVGKLTGLYPTDPLQAAFCDEAMDAGEEASGPLVATFAIKDEAEKKARRQEIADGHLTFFLTRLQRRLEARGGEFFADNRLTVADLKVYLWIRHIKSGNLDYIPKDLPDRIAPLLVSHYERVKEHPKIKAYYEMRAAS